MRAESSGIDRPEETAPRHDISPAAFGQPSGTRPSALGAGECAPPAPTATLPRGFDEGPSKGRKL
ncbi:hypothetical protein GS506_06145 [Rhodococcus hoagii]|nr:hypothetical protein [Prescottella equi]